VWIVDLFHQPFPMNSSLLDYLARVVIDQALMGSPHLAWMTDAQWTRWCHAAAGEVAMVVQRLNSGS
jgi:hypothetical protein